jgi:hypothetical protein
MVALIAVNAAPFVNGASTSADEVVAQLRGLAQLSIFMGGRLRRPHRRR